MVTRPTLDTHSTHKDTLPPSCIIQNPHNLQWIDTLFLRIALFNAAVGLPNEPLDGATVHEQVYGTDINSLFDEQVTSEGACLLLPVTSFVRVVGSGTTYAGDAAFTVAHHLDEGFL